MYFRTILDVTQLSSILLQFFRDGSGSSVKSGFGDMIAYAMTDPEVSRGIIGLRRSKRSNDNLTHELSYRGPQEHAAACPDCASAVISKREPLPARGPRNVSPAIRRYASADVRS